MKLLGVLYHAVLERLQKMEAVTIQQTTYVRGITIIMPIDTIGGEIVFIFGTNYLVALFGDGTRADWDADMPAGLFAENLVMELRKESEK